MEIIRQNYADFFANLESGDVFIDDDNDVFMKIERHDDKDKWLNAVCLSNGEMLHCDESERIHKVNATLTIG